jgi:hypothetical protein
MRSLLLVSSTMILCASIIAQNPAPKPITVYPPTAAEPVTRKVTSVNDVIRLSKAGVSDAVIIAQIKKSPHTYDLTADQLIEMKASHVSDTVIQQLQLKSPPVVATAALDAPTLAPKERTGANSGTQRNEPVLPMEEGLCVSTSNGCNKLFGQIASFERTGSRFVNWITLDIKAAHDNVQVLGPHAQMVVDPQPTFYFIPAKPDAEAGIDAGELLLMRLEQKTHRRQYEVEARGTWRGSKGVTPTHQIQLVRSEEGHQLYRLTPAKALPKGEYALYLVRGDGKSPIFYEFSVE